MPNVANLINKSYTKITGISNVLSPLNAIILIKLLAPQEEMSIWMYSINVATLPTQTYNPWWKKNAELPMTSANNIMPMFTSKFLMSTYKLFFEIE